MRILAINGKVVLADGQPIVSSGSGGGIVADVAPNDITFCDYDGTVVAAWTLDELSGKTALPMLANPNAFTGIAEDCQIRVPSSLVDDWKAAASWASLADCIVGV